MTIGNAAAYTAEYTPATLRAVAAAVVDRFAGVGWEHIGIKGNDAHYGGYHRSLRWCRVSRGKGVDYSDQISRDTSQINTRRKDALRALDITAPSSILIPMCSRVDWAMRHGLIDDVREWYGNDDGNNYVDGYDNFFNEVVTSDDSHLWHLHISLYTDTVEAPHDRLIAVLLGAPGWNNLEDDMGLSTAGNFVAGNSEAQALRDLWWATFRGNAGAVEQQTLARIELTQKAILTAISGVNEESVLAAVREESQRVQAALAAHSAAEVERDAANVATLLDRFGELADPITGTELRAALRDVYGDAFDRATDATAQG